MMGAYATEADATAHAATDPTLMYWHAGPAKWCVDVRPQAEIVMEVTPEPVVIRNPRGAPSPARRNRHRSSCVVA